MSRAAKLALITGAGRETGLGFETAQQLGASGVEVILTARDISAAEARAVALTGQGLKAHALELDITSPSSIQAAFDEIEQRFGTLDILINNAASTASYGERVIKADLSVSRAVMDTILFGAWQLTKAMLPLLLRSESPRVVNVTSGAGSHADAQFGLTSDNAMGTSYAVAKAALNALTARLAHEEPNLLVNAVCPGFTATFEGGEEMGARPVAEGAKGIVWAALLPNGGPTGGFFRDGKPLGW